MIKEYVKLAITSIKHRKLRTSLTILGIIIGVAAIVSLISISQGLQYSIQEQFQKMGSNRIYLSPKGSFGQATQGLTTKDIELIEKLPEIEYAMPYIIFYDRVVKFSRVEKQVTIIGLPTEDFDKRWADMDFKTIEGKLFSGGEKGKAIIGYKVSTEMFDPLVIHTNNNIQINDKKFSVYGVMKEIGNSQDDNQIYLPEDDARELYDLKDTVHYAEIKIKPGLDVNLVADGIQKRLKKFRDDENFEIFTPEQLLQQLKTILGIIQVVLVGIAAISIIVGAIGITNSMYTNVLERTKDIGIMKSIGAKNSDILTIFLIESGMQGFIGGTIGIMLGVGIGKIVEYLAKISGVSLLKVPINPLILLGGLLFAVIVGLVSGYFPARQAAKLRPVDALKD